MKSSNLGSGSLTTAKHTGFAFLLTYLLMIPWGFAFKTLSGHDLNLLSLPGTCSFLVAFYCIRRWVRSGAIKNPSVIASPEAAETQLNALSATRVEEYESSGTPPKLRWPNYAGLLFPAGTLLLLLFFLGEYTGRSIYGSYNAKLPPFFAPLLLLSIVSLKIINPGWKTVATKLSSTAVKSFALLLFIGSAVAGVKVGYEGEGKERLRQALAAFTSEIQAFKSLQSQVFAERNGELKSAEDYMTMYKKIQPKLATLSESLHRITNLISEILVHDSTKLRNWQALQEVCSLNQRQIELLQQEVTVSGRMQLLRSQDRHIFFNENILPLIKREAQIEQQLVDLSKSEQVSDRLEVNWKP